jgi:hypothetical protein
MMGDSFASHAGSRPANPAISGEERDSRKAIVADPQHSKSKKAAFPNIDRDQLKQEVEARRHKPSLISSEHSSLCGPAALMYLTARYRPYDYERYVMNLYDHGHAKLGDLTIRPDMTCRKHTPPVGRLADWVALAGLRNSDNLFLGYSGTESKLDQFEAMTLPSTLAGWLEKVGFSDVTDETNYDLSKNELHLAEDHFKEAANRYGGEYEICLLINHHGLYTPPDSYHVLPDHWVVLTSEVTFHKSSVEFTVYTWGDDEWAPPKSGSMTLEEWVRSYYGYIACIPPG